MFYRIVIHGEGSQVQTVFSDLDLEQEGELSVLTGPVLDQSQLQGILAMILGLDLQLISFEPVDPVSLQ